jgi:hypothetical protein
MLWTMMKFGLARAVRRVGVARLGLARLGVARRRGRAASLVLAMLAAGLAAVAPMGPTTRASVVEVLGLAELTVAARDVVLVDVIDLHARWDERRRIVTDVRMRVVESMKGDARPGSVLVLVRLGGAIGDLGMRVEGEASFAAGMRALVFAVRAEDGHLRALGLAQGVMPVVRRGAPGGDDLVLPGGAGLSLVRRDGPHLRPMPPAVPVARPLAAVRADIALALRAAEAPGAGSR